MATSVQLHIWPKEIGSSVNDRGNVEIVGMDREDGTVVIIEIASQQWPHILKQLGRMRGVGIHKANRKIEVVSDLPEGIDNGA